MYELQDKILQFWYLYIKSGTLYLANCINFGKKTL